MNDCYPSIRSVLLPIHPLDSTAFVVIALSHHRISQKCPL